jgi:DNA-binding transcriptional ArsR family regulator
MNEAVQTILLQPTRFKIALHMANATEAEYLDQIAAAVQESSRLVAHHLELLEDIGLVKSEFRIIEAKDSSRGFAGRFFEPLPKLKEALTGLAELATSGRKEVKHEK